MKRGYRPNDVTQVVVVLLSSHEGCIYTDEYISLRPPYTRVNSKQTHLIKLRLDTLANGLVHVNVLVLREDGRDVEFGKSAKLVLEGQSRLDVTNAVVLSVLGSTECVVARIGTIRVTTHER